MVNCHSWLGADDRATVGTTAISRGRQTVSAAYGRIDVVQCRAHQPTCGPDGLHRHEEVSCWPPWERRRGRADAPRAFSFPHRSHAGQSTPPFFATALPGGRPAFKTSLTMPGPSSHRAEPDQSRQLQEEADGVTPGGFFSCWISSACAASNTKIHAMSAQETSTSSGNGIKVSIVTTNVRASRAIKGGHFCIAIQFNGGHR